MIRSIYSSRLRSFKYYYTCINKEIFWIWTYTKETICTVIKGVQHDWAKDFIFLSSCFITKKFPTIYLILMVTY